MHAAKKYFLVTISVVPSSPILVTVMKEAQSSFESLLLQEPHAVTSQKTPFFIVTAVNISNRTWFYSVTNLIRRNRRRSGMYTYEQCDSLKQIFHQVLPQGEYFISTQTGLLALFTGNIFIIAVSDDKHSTLMNTFCGYYAEVLMFIQV
jgi:hypothetical protein